MAGEKFNWKSLFVNDENGTSKEETVTQNVTSSTTTFPTKATNTFPTNEIPTGEIADDVKNSIIGVYEKGFETINRQGFDFFEFFKSVTSVDSNNPSTFQMAYSMGKGVQSDLTKEKLIADADFYISEINKVHAGYDTQGNTKKSKIEGEKQNEQKTLTERVSKIEEQIMKLQTELHQTKDALVNLDAKYIGELKEINDKIIANNLAKDNLINRINFIVNGIKSHIN